MYASMKTREQETGNKRYLWRGSELKGEVLRPSRLPSEQGSIYSCVKWRTWKPLVLTTCAPGVLIYGGAEVLSPFLIVFLDP